MGRVHGPHSLGLEPASNRPGPDHEAMIGHAGDQNVDLLLPKLC